MAPVRERDASLNERFRDPPRRALARNDDRQRPRRLRQRRAHLRETAVGERLGDGVPRQAADADAGGDDSLDRFAAAELELDPQRRDAVEQEPVGGFARARARLAQDPRGVGRARRRRPCGRRADATGAAKIDELVGQPAANDDVGVALAALDEAESTSNAATASMTSLVLPMTSRASTSG